MTTLTLFHIPVCPFCQRIEIMLELKGLSSFIHFVPIDITIPRPDWLLQKTGGSSALPVIETADGKIIKESLVIMQYLEDSYPQSPVAQHDPYRRAVEGMLVRMEGDFVTQGYTYVMNQDRTRSAQLREGMLQQYARLNAFLQRYNPAGPWLFEQFGWAEAVFTPFFMRFWFLEYFEGFTLPDDPQYARVRQWQTACLSHPAAQQVSYEQIIKTYHDYAHGAGNGSLLPGRNRSTFVFEPDWRMRPMPPRTKYDYSATDQELGLL